MEVSCIDHLEKLANVSGDSEVKSCLKNLCAEMSRRMAHSQRHLLKRLNLRGRGEICYESY